MSQCERRSNLSLCVYIYIRGGGRNRERERKIWGKRQRGMYMVRERGEARGLHAAYLGMGRAQANQCLECAWGDGHRFPLLLAPQGEVVGGNGVFRFRG